MKLTQKLCNLITLEKPHCWGKFLLQAQTIPTDELKSVATRFCAHFLMMDKTKRICLTGTVGIKNTLVHYNFRPGTEECLDDFF